MQWFYDNVLKMSLSRHLRHQTRKWSLRRGGGGDPLQFALARGGREPSLGVVNQELRGEIVQLRQSLLQEVHASQIRSQELSTRFSSQAWRAMQWQNERFHETAQHYEQVSEDVTEAAVAQERAVQRANQQQQLNGYQTVLLQVESNVQQHAFMLQQAQQAHAEALEKGNTQMRSRSKKQH